MMLLFAQAGLGQTVLYAILAAIIPAVVIGFTVVCIYLRNTIVSGDDDSFKSSYMHGDIKFYNHVVQTSKELSPDSVRNPNMKDGYHAGNPTSSSLKHKRPQMRPAVANPGSEKPGATNK